MCDDTQRNRDVLSDSTHLIHRQRSISSSHLLIHLLTKLLYHHTPSLSASPRKTLTFLVLELKKKNKRNFISLFIMRLIDCCLLTTLQEENYLPCMAVMVARQLLHSNITSNNISIKLFLCLLSSLQGLGGEQHNSCSPLSVHARRK